MQSGLIIEDIPETQKWLTRLLETSFPGIVIETANSVEDAVQLISSKPHDIALVDLGLPDGSGVDCIRLRSSRWTGVPSVVTTSFEDDKHLFLALQAGAAGYILKDHDEKEIIHLLKGIKAGNPPLSPIIARKIINHFQAPANHHADVQLTKREKVILSYIAKGHSVPETADELGKSRNTVSSQLKSIYSKLNVSSRAEFTRKVLELGLL